MAPTVLIVDDHPTFRRFARQLLEEAGYDVVGEAADGVSAVEAIRALQPQLVLLDVLLPDISGLAVADEVAALSHAPDIVLVSSRSAADLGAALDGATPRFIPKHELTVASLAALVAGP